MILRSMGRDYDKQMHVKEQQTTIESHVKVSSYKARMQPYANVTMLV